MVEGATGFGSLNNLQTGDFEIPKISLSLQNSYVVFLSSNELVEWAKEGTETECDVLVILHLDSIPSIQVDSALNVVSQNLIAARESIKKHGESSASLSKDSSGVKVPTALKSPLERLATSLKKLTSKNPKSEKPEKPKKDSKAKKVDDLIPPDNPPAAAFDPFD
jgi:hypothetical protein